MQNIYSGLTVSLKMSNAEEKCQAKKINILKCVRVSALVLLRVLNWVEFVMLPTLIKEKPHSKSNLRS